MPRSFRGWISLCVLSFVVTGCSRAAANDAEPRWYTDALIPDFVRERPRSSSDFDRILRAPWIDGPTIQLRDGDRREDRTVGSCKELLDLQDRIWKVYSPARDNELMQWKVMCKAIARMPAIRSPRVDYVARELKPLVRDLATVHPPFFQDLARIESMKCPEPSWCTVHTTSRDFGIALMASGDLDGDGVGDAMLQASSTESGSRSTATIGLIVTRTAPDAPLKVVASW